MDFRKVFDQTVRELKREVNKSILKVPEIEQKVLDATSNEPWGPHGTVMADIAQGTRNHYELQMIMAILWKRLSDTGRNWRHVYKALTVLEYLVAHGSERVIDEIREHVYQISTLSDFQYVESNGKDQGLNVRKKSQTLVTLVNDKEKIREVRQKAIENRDKYRGVSSTGGMYKPSSYNSMGGGYGDRYEEDSYSRYGRRDDDGYGRDRDVDRYREDGSYGREGDRSSRTGNQYRDEGYENDEDQYNSHRGGDRFNDKLRSYERNLDRAHNYTDRNSSRGAGGRNSDHGEDDKKGAEKQLTGPPSYEEALQSPEHHATRASESVVVQSATSSSITNKAPLVNNDLDEFDDFNPRASSAPLKLDDVFNQSEPNVAVRNLSPTPGLANVFGDVSDLFGETISSSLTTGPPPVNSYPVQHLAGDLFVDSPFEVEASGISTTASAQIAIKPPPSYSPPSGNGLQPSVHPSSIAFVRQPPSHTTPNTGNEAASAPSTFAPTTPSPPPNQSANRSFGADGLFGVDSFNVLGAASSGAPQSALSLNTGMNPQPAIAGALQANQPPPPSSSQPLFSGAGQGQPLSSSTHTKSQQEKRFETKSAVWSDGFSKGLIDLNIGGPKTNSLADIGIDFDLLRTESVKEERIMSGKGVSNSKGKAMGSGSGLGMAGASAIVPPAAPAMMNNMRMPPMGMGMGMGAGMGMGPPMMQMGMNPGLSMRPSMSMKAGMGGVPNQQQQYGGLR